MKKFMKSILLVCALSSLAYAEEAVPVVATGASTMSAEDQKEAMDILDRMREKIEKEEEEKARPSIMDEQKAEVTEQASPAEVPQEAAPAEANAQEKAVEQTK